MNWLKGLMATPRTLTTHLHTLRKAARPCPGISVVANQMTSLLFWQVWLVGDDCHLNLYFNLYFFVQAVFMIINLHDYSDIQGIY